MNLEDVLRELGWGGGFGGQADPVVQRNAIAWARRVLSGRSPAASVEQAHKILAAADGTPEASPPEPASTPAPAEPAARPDIEVILGYTSGGQAITLVDVKEEGLDAAWDSCATLTPFGARARQAFEEIRLDPLRRRAAALGVDTQALEAWAASTGADPAEVLQGEIEFQELVARNRAAEGLPPATPRGSFPAPAPQGPTAEEIAQGEADLQAIMDRDRAFGLGPSAREKE